MQLPDRPCIGIQLHGLRSVLSDSHGALTGQIARFVLRLTEKDSQFRCEQRGGLRSYNQQLTAILDIVHHVLFEGRLQIVAFSYHD